MTAQEWNQRYPVGTRVELTLAGGEQRMTRTLGPAQTWGGLDHIQVGGIGGFVLLSRLVPAEAKVV